jgi:glycosyltransferase involved in cell wall biosynthesis
VRVAVTLEQCWHRVPGGTARSAIEQAAALARLDDGGAVELVGVAARHREPAPDEWAPPIPVRQLPLPRPLLYRSWHALGWPTVEQVTGPVDAVHATAMAIPATKAPLVVTVHDLAFLDDPSVATARGLRFFRRAIELARERAQLLLCPSETTIAECVRAGFDPELLRLVPWGVRTFDVDDRAKAAVRERYQLDRRFILFCGTLEPRKNLRRLLEAFTKLELDDVDLVLAGWHGWDAAIEPLIAATQGRARAIGAGSSSWQTWCAIRACEKGSAYRCLRRWRRARRS